jgi:acid phosphatase
LIVMENRSYDQAITGAYTAQLAAKYAVATNYHGVSHPSLPNYLALTSGSTWGIADDGWHPLPAGGLGAQLTAAGISWRAYMEGLIHTSSRAYDHYSLLASVADRFELPRLGEAAHANAMTDLLLTLRF